MNIRRKNVPDDSEEESSSAASDATVLNVNTTNKRKQPRRQKAKRPRSLNSSSRDTSPQPGPSGLCNNHNSTENSDSDESESVDSDYAPLIDATHRRKRKPPQRKKEKKKKSLKPVNGISSNKKAEKGSQPSTAKRKSACNNQIKAGEVESLAQKLVYFLLTEDQKKYAIKRKNIKAFVFKDEDCFPKLYNAVLKKANDILQKIYGMELMEIQDQKDSYLIINKLDKELGIHDYVEMPKLKQQQRGLILYLITVIFMNGNVITQDELTKCLRPLGIDLTSKKLHPIFGDVKKYIVSELVKQMYLSYELISKDPEKYEIKWGIRAIQEFDKREILQFSCQITGHRPEEWRIQFKDAEESANPQANGNS